MAASVGILVAVLLLASPTAGDVVQTDTGLVEGGVQDGSLVWLGIPFAASTGGANRFLPPQPRVPWPGVLQTTQFGPGCYQTHHNPDVPKNVSEDCLNLNVFVPVNSSGPLPVMVFFHGGSFDEGSNQGPFDMYSAAAFVAQHPLIVVTANYRLGALGWVCTHEIKGNMGLMDQHSALTWVNRNIKAFGGDPTTVTMWGESAGAMSVGIHLLNNRSSGLYRRAIMESNVAGFVYKTEMEARGYGLTFCKILHCETGHGLEEQCNTTCMQEQTPAAIGQAWNEAGNNVPDIVIDNWGHWLSAALDFTPTVDHDWVPDLPVTALSDGRLPSNVDILMGSNEDEGATFIYDLKFSLPGFLYEGAVLGIFGETDGKKILGYYAKQAPGPMGDARDVFSAVLTDFWFHCSSEQFVSQTVKQGGHGYFYHFKHVFSSGWIYTKFLPAVCATRTCHATELPFVFDAASNPTLKAMNVTFTPDELQLISNFNTYWAAFAIYGDPNMHNVTGLPQWPVWDEQTRSELLLQTPAPSLSNSQALCTFWDSIGYVH